VKKLLFVLTILILLSIQQFCQARQIIAGYKIYYGETHAHCAVGGDDGKQIAATVDAAYEFAYKKAKLDFFGLSSHAHMIDNNFFHTLIKKSRQYTRKGFAGLYGSEWGILSTTGHLNTHFVKNMLTNKPAKGSNPFYEMHKYFSWLEKQKTGVAILNHPEPFDFGYYYNPVGDRFVCGIEVFSGPAFESRILRHRRGKDYSKQYLILLNRGWHAGAFSNQDNHMMTWGLASTNLTGVLAKTLSPKSVEDAYKKRRTFATADVNLAIVMTATSPQGKKYIMGEEIYNASGKYKIEVFVDDEDKEPVREIALYSDIADNEVLGKFIARVKNKNYLVHYVTADFSNKFYVAKVKQKDGDTAWTSPIWLTSISKFQGELSRLLILKSQLAAVKLHKYYYSEYNEVKTDYYKKLQDAERYLEMVERMYWTDVYTPVKKAKGKKLKKYLKEAWEFLKSLNVIEKTLFFKDLHRLAKEIQMSEENKKMIQEFIDKTFQEYQNIKYDKQKLEKLGEQYAKAQNYDHSIYIYNLLIDKFPSDKQKYLMKLTGLYSMIDAYNTAIGLGGKILKRPNLDPELMYEAYMLVAKAYERLASDSRKAESIKALKAAVEQYLQLLKDYKKIPLEKKLIVYEKLGDDNAKLMKKFKKQPEEFQKYFVNARAWYKKVLRLLRNAKKIVQINDKMSDLIFAYDASKEKILKLIKRFEGLIHVYHDQIEIYKHLGALYTRYASKLKQNEKKIEAINSAINYYKKYITSPKPRGLDKVYYSLGILYKRLKNWNNALKYYKKVEEAAKYSSRLEDSLFEIANCYENLNKPAEGVKVLKRLLKEFPNYRKCYNNYKNKQVLNPMESVVGRKLIKLEGRIK